MISLTLSDPPLAAPPPTRLGLSSAYVPIKPPPSLSSRPSGPESLCPVPALLLALRCCRHSSSCYSQIRGDRHPPKKTDATKELHDADRTPTASRSRRPAPGGVSQREDPSTAAVPPTPATHLGPSSPFIRSRYCHFFLMVKTNGALTRGKGSKNEGAVRSSFKVGRSKDLQLHHLPPDILRDILSRLTLKEAVRMSILYKKGKHLWKHHPKLVFTRATMRSRNAMAGHQKPFRTRFIRGINSVLRQLKSADLCKFVVKFGLRERHTRHINRWVNFSAALRAKHVVFDLCAGPKGSADTDNRYSFPLDMFNASGGSCVKHLCLGFVSLTLPPDFCGFKHLKKLSLDKVVIAGELQCLLPECSVLEWLSITFCKLVGLTISQHLSRLFFLRVKYCNLQELNVHAPNLSTFEFADNLTPIVLGESLNISEATIYLFSSLDCFDYVFSKLLNNGFSRVQSLTVNLNIKTEVQGFVKNPFRMTFLRRVVLKVDISGWSGSSAGILRLAYLLELAPVLEELVLNMCCFATPLYIWELNEDGFTPCPHSHLKTVHMTGFYGYHGQLQLALYILRNATCLECLIIDPMVKNNCFVPPQKPDDGDIDIGRRSARHHLLRKGFGKVLQIL